MTRFKILLILGIIVLFGLSCSQFGSGPEDNQTGFRFNIKFGEIEGDKLGLDGVQSGLSKSLNGTPYNVARVMALGYPEYEKWEDVTQDSNWYAFTNERDNLIPADSLDYYSRWERLLSKYFTVMDNDTLDIDDGYATGNVVGAEGLNRFLVTFNKDDYIIYWGEGIGYGVTGVLTNVEITVHQQNSIPGDSTISGLSILPDSSQIALGDSVQLHCIATLPAGGGTDTVNAQASWSLSSQTRGSVSQDGLFVADGDEGFVTITAEYADWNAVASVEVVSTLFSDDFESYNVGEYPSNMWEKYSGVSGAVSDEEAKFGTQSFKQVGQSGWGRRDVIDLPAVNQLNYSYYILLADSGEGNNVGLFQDVAPWGELYAYVHFARDQSIAFRDAGTGARVNTTATWVPGQWHQVEVSVDYQTQKASLTYDGVLLVPEMDIGIREYTGFSLGYMDQASGTYYFDNIEIRVDQ